jgi:hypothetical protein
VTHHNGCVCVCELTRLRELVVDRVLDREKGDRVDREDGVDCLDDDD